MQLPLTRDEMKALVDEIIALKFAADNFADDAPARAIPLPPAGARELATLESRLAGAGLVLPPSYRTLLSVCDGIEYFFDDPDMALLSCAQVAGGKFDKTAEDFPPLAKFVIAAGNTSAFVSFDASTGGAGREYEVVHINTEGAEYRADDLTQFLTLARDSYKDVVELSRADRENLADD